MASTAQVKVLQRELNDLSKQSKPLLDDGVLGEKTVRRLFDVLGDYSARVSDSAWKQEVGLLLVPIPDWRGSTQVTANMVEYVRSKFGRFSFLVTYLASSSVKPISWRMIGPFGPFLSQ